MLNAEHADRGQTGGYRRLRTAHDVAGINVGNVDTDPLADVDRVEIRRVFAEGGFRVGAGLTIVVEHLRHPTLKQLAEVFNTCDCGHWASPDDNSASP